MHRRKKTGILAAPSIALWVAAVAFAPADEHGAATGSAAGDGAVRAPAHLSATGLYAADGSIAAGNIPFAPQYPLWTDGATKRRWIRLPEGSTIDIRDIDLWRFPAGTRLWKEFSWSGRRVETRMIWKTDEDSWVFATYVWNEEETDATLAPDEGVRDAHELAAGKRHSIPSLVDCNACHRGNPSVVLGFSALQLSDDRDPLAPHAEPLPEGGATLATLVASGRLQPARRDLVTHPPRIHASTPEERATLGYLSGNCGACHNATGPLARVGLTLLHEVAREGTAPEPSIASALGVPGRYVVPGVSAEDSRLIAPGDPARSAIRHRMASRRPSSQMPPLGTVIQDSVAVALVTRWIEGLGAGTLHARADRD